MIVTKTELLDDSTLSEPPPSYDTINAPIFVPGDSKALQARTSAHISLSHVQSSSSVPKSPPPSTSKARGKSSSNWFAFSSRRTTRNEVHSTVLGLVRDLVREQRMNARAAQGVLESCSDACSGYDLVLADILQEKSIENHTPLYWAAVKRPQDGEDDDNTLPDLLTVLLSYAAPLTPKTISDVRHACLITSDQALFQRLRMSPEFAPLSGTDEMLLGGKIPPDEITVEDVEGDEGSFIVHFLIAHFQKRMHISQHIELEFIARARMWKLEFEIAQKHEFRCQGSWCISLSLVDNSPPTWIDSRLVISDHTTSDSPSPSVLPFSPSLLGRVMEKNTPGKPPIIIRLKSPQKLVASDCSSKHRSPESSITVSLEDSATASSLQYAGTTYISPDETLRVRLEASLGRPPVDADCVVC